MISLSIGISADPDTTDSHDSFASIQDSLPTIIDSWIIINDTSADVWNSTPAGVKTRSDSYIWEGETLEIHLIISDDDELDLYEYQYSLFGNFDPPYTDSIVFILDHYTNPEMTEALFIGTMTIPSPNLLQCTHQVIVDDDDETNPETPHRVYMPLYINPEVTPSFTPTTISWSSLKVGDIEVDADSIHSQDLLAQCENASNPGYYEDVAVDYLLSINGSDMKNETYADSIPVSNIEFNMNGGLYSILKEVYADLGGPFVANNPRQFGFRITVPSVIAKGDYSGKINFEIDAI